MATNSTEQLNPNNAPLNETERALRERLWSIGFQIIEDAPDNHISWDIEGDGPAFGLGNVLSWGGIAPDGDEFYDEIKPLFPDNFDPGQRQFCEEHGLEIDRLIREGTDPAEAVQKLAAWVNRQTEKTGKRPRMVGQAIAWDWSMTHAYFAKAGIEDPFGIKPLDICSEALPGIAGYDMKRTGKDDFPRFIWPDQDFPHNALEDSKIQAYLHAGVLGLNAAMMNPTLAQELDLGQRLRARGFEDVAHGLQ